MYSTSKRGKKTSQPTGHTVLVAHMPHAIFRTTSVMHRKKKTDTKVIRCDLYLLPFLLLHHVLSRCCVVVFVVVCVALSLFAHLMYAHSVVIAVSLFIGWYWFWVSLPMPLIWRHLVPTEWQKKRSRNVSRHSTEMTKKKIVFFSSKSVDHHRPYRCDKSYA